MLFANASHESCGTRSASKIRRIIVCSKRPHLDVSYKSERFLRAKEGSVEGEGKRDARQTAGLAFALVRDEAG